MADVPASPLFSGRPSVVRAIGFMLISALLNAIVNAMVKHLSADLHPFELVFFRSLFGFLALSPMLFRHGLVLLRTTRFELYLVRAAMAVSSMLMTWYALKIAELAKVVALTFTQPLFATAMAALFLGEVLRARRVAALAVGFAGVIVVVQPSGAGLDLGALLVIGGAALAAGVVIMIKLLARTESSLTLTFYSAMLGAPLALMAALPFWRWPSGEELIWLAVMGAISVVGQLFFTQAYAESDVAAVAPVQFTRLVWAAGIGFFVFGEIPGLPVWTGGAMIFASVTYIAYRERRLRAARAKPAANAPPTA